MILTLILSAYCGEYFDAETQTVYLRARYYDPATGRFTSQDTHWNPRNMVYGDNPDKDNPTPNAGAIAQSSNLYGYCMNNPVGYIDPTGNEAVLVLIALLLIALAGLAGAGASTLDLPSGNDIASAIGNDLRTIGDLKTKATVDFVSAVTTMIATTAIEINAITVDVKQIQLTIAQAKKIENNATYQFAFIGPKNPLDEQGELIRTYMDVDFLTATNMLVAGKLVNSVYGLMKHATNMYGLNIDNMDREQKNSFLDNLHWGFYTHKQKDAMVLAKAVGFEHGSNAEHHGSGQYKHYNSKITDGPGMHVWYGGKVA